jgi:WD40 repeat protein
VAVHPLGYFVVAASKNGTFSYHDLLKVNNFFVNKKNQCVYSNQDYKGTVQFTTVRIHPDGSFLALGTNEGNIIIWNICENSLIASLKDNNKVFIFIEIFF